MVYPRIDYPASGYTLQSIAQASIQFERPTFSKLVVQQSAKPNEAWFNLEFTGYNATLYLSVLKTEKSMIPTILAEKERLVYQQALRESAVFKQEFISKNQNINGLYYRTEGQSPSPIQFVLHNNQNRLCMGSLVFNYAFNPDSISSVLDGMNADIRNLVETFNFTTTHGTLSH